MYEGADSASHSVVGVLKPVPEPELETVAPLGHLHKIGHEVPSIEGSIRSSTSIQGCWAGGPGTWHECQVG